MWLRLNIEKESESVPSTVTQFCAAVDTETCFTGGDPETQRSITAGWGNRVARTLKTTISSLTPPKHISVSSDFHWNYMAGAQMEKSNFQNMKKYRNMMTHV